MYLMIPAVIGVTGAMIAGHLGYNLADYQGWLVNLPWWLLGGAINMK